MVQHVVHVYTRRQAVLKQLHISRPGGGGGGRAGGRAGGGNTHLMAVG